MPQFDQAQSPRLGQRTPVEATYVRMFDGVDIPEAAWTGQMIYRTDRHVLQVYTDAGAWEDVLGGIGNSLTFVGPSVPVSQDIGDVWYDTDDNYKLYIARSANASAVGPGLWELAQDSATAQETAENAAQVASTKVTTFYQIQPPPQANAPGDLWVDIGDSNKMYRAFQANATAITDTGWVLVQDSATAQSTANIKNTVYLQDAIPIDIGNFKLNDVWIDTNNDNLINVWDGSQWVPTKYGTGALDTDTLTMNALTTLGNVNMRGIDNTLSGSMVLTSGVTNPGQAPVVAFGSWDYVTQSFSVATLYGFDVRNLWYDGSNFIYTDTVLYSGNVNSINKTTGARSLLATMPSQFGPYGGAVKIGSTWFVLGKDGNRNGDWWVYTFNTSWVKQPLEWLATADANNSCTIGTDGAGGLLIAKRFFANDTLGVQPVSTSGVGGTQISCGPLRPSTLMSINKSPVDTGTSRFVIAVRDTGVKVYNATTGAETPSESWPTPAGQCRGIAYDGTNFYSQDGYNVYKYTNLIGTWDFAFTWRDDDLGGSGRAETQASTLRTLAPTKRSKWTISLPSLPPDDGTTDGANTAALYAAPTGNTLALQADLIEPNTSQTFSTLTSTPTGGRPPVSNDFAMRLGAFGDITTQGLNAATGDPNIEIVGDGTGNFGPFGTAADGTPTLTNTTNYIAAASNWTLSSLNARKWGKYTEITFAATRTTSDLTVTAVGDVTNSTVGTLVTGWRPTMPRPGTSNGTGRVSQWVVNTDGTVQLSAVSSGGDVTVGTVLTCAATYISA